MQRPSWTNEIGENHHAYLITGGGVGIIRKLNDFLETKWGIIRTGNPDFHHFEFDTMTINDSREIGRLETGRAFSNGKKIFIVAFNFATREAQNSLLKVLEEPTGGTYFFIIVPQANLLLPTLQSRLSTVKSLVSDKDNEVTEFGHIFIDADRKERLTMARELCDDIAEDRKSKQFALHLLEFIEREMWKRARNETPQAINSAIFDDISMSKRYIGDRSSSLKLILEHLALVLPL